MNIFSFIVYITDDDFSINFLASNEVPSEEIVQSTVTSEVKFIFIILQYKLYVYYSFHKG